MRVTCDLAQGVTTILHAFCNVCFVHILCPALGIACVDKVYLVCFQSGPEVVPVENKDEDGPSKMATAAVSMPVPVRQSLCHTVLCFSVKVDVERLVMLKHLYIACAHWGNVHITLSCV